MGALRAAVLALPVLFTAPAAIAEDLPPLLERALSYGEAADQIRWGFTAAFRSGEADFSYRYEPFAGDASFELLAPDALDADAQQIYNRLREEVDVDSDLTYEQARVVIGDQVPVVVEETDTYVTYEVRPNRWDDLDDQEAQIMSHMMAQMTVDKETALVTEIRLYNPEPFHAMVVARIDDFETVMTFEPEPATGLPLMVSLTQDIRGSALFQSFHQTREESYGAFVPRAEDGEELACAQAACVQEFLRPE